MIDLLQKTNDRSRCRQSRACMSVQPCPQSHGLHHMDYVTWITYAHNDKLCACTQSHALHVPTVIWFAHAQCQSLRMPGLMVLFL